MQRHYWLTGMLIALASIWLIPASGMGETCIPLTALPIDSTAATCGSSPFIPTFSASGAAPPCLATFDLTCKPAPIGFDLIRAINRALEANRQLSQSYDAVTKAELNLDLQENEFNWQIRPNGQVGYVDGNSNEGMNYGIGLDVSKWFPIGTRLHFRPQIDRSPNHWYTNVKLSISQPLLRGFSREYTLAGVLGAQFITRTAYRNLYLARIRLILKTVGEVYDVIRLEQMHRLNAESLERVRGFRDAAKLKERIGLADALDVYRAEIELRHAEDSLQSSEEHLQNAYDLLKDLLALSLELEIAVYAPLVYKEVTVSLESAIETALANRIEVDQAIDVIRDAQRQTRLARQNLLPELNLVFDYNNGRSDTSFFNSCSRKRDNVWGIGFTTSSTPFNPAAQQAMLDTSLLVQGEPQRELDQVYTDIILETKRAYRSLQRAAKRIKLQQEQIQTSEGELHLSQIKFNRGFANNFDVIQAERNLRMARHSLIGAIIDHILGEYQLLAAMGMLADKPMFNTCY